MNLRIKKLFTSLTKDLTDMAKYKGGRYIIQEYKETLIINTINFKEKRFDINKTRVIRQQSFE